MHKVADHIQCAVGAIQLPAQIAGPTPSEVIARIPDPASPMEERLLRGLLVDLSLRWAVTVHRRLHTGTIMSWAFRDDATVHDAWQDRGRGWPAKKTFAAWAAGHFQALHRVHPLPIERAAEWITAHSRERVTDVEVARAVGLHVVALRRRFRQTYGVSVHAYLQRARLADVMRLLSTGPHNVRSALYAAGWRSAKSLYEASLCVAGMPLADLRALDREDWERRLAVLPQTRGTSGAVLSELESRTGVSSVRA
jgi:AraC-like DNA-binding protein